MKILQDIWQDVGSGTTIVGLELVVFSDFGGCESVLCC